MPDLKVERQEMPVQDPAIRAHNFKEVALGYSEEVALIEASRCLNCKNKPCVAGCPVNIDIPSFIKEITQKEYDKAYDIISSSSSLPAVCGRVCPQENQCEAKCVRGIKSKSVAIGRLERFVSDLHNEKEEEIIKPKKNGYKVAVIGSGPAGLSCAGTLAKKGYDVTIFEALHVAGGVLSYGIPEFRLPKKIVQKETSNLAKLDVKIKTDMVIGKVLTIDEILNDLGFDAVFIGTGAGLPKFMNIKGENLNGVYSANEYLTRVNLMKAYLDNSSTPIKQSENVIVVGGGNVAMDAARCALRLGAKQVTIVYRRSMEELPARKEEVEHAVEEGIKFALLTNPVEILGDDKGNVRSVEVIDMELGAPGEDGRRRPVEKVGSNHEIIADTVIMALGTTPNPLIKNTTKGIEVTKWGGIITNINGETSKENVYAGGDAVTGAATVILAAAAGTNAANAIDQKLMGEKE